jgi:tRNA A37 threonylcarbamoyladenosine dehydratase
VVVGAAGGKRYGHQVDVADLADVTHDPLLASLRQSLRRSGAASRTGSIGLRCVFSREPVMTPSRAEGDSCAVDGSLNCHGYGSTVTVTAAFGLAAAGEAIDSALRGFSHI